MKKKRAKSEIIADFINLVDDCIKEYDVAFDFVNKTDKATQDILHSIEFSKSSKERNKYSNELHYVRNIRRCWKDIREEAEILNEYRKEYNKAVNVLKQCLGEMRKVESYHAQRTYKPRIFKEDKENKTMNKKDFIEIMNEIDKHIAVEKNIEELEISMNDNHDLVKFFVYGVNFAKKEPLVVYINNEKVSIYTDEELYDTLLRIMDKNVEISVGRK